MEKKLWSAPEVESLEISGTEYKYFTGTVVDGPYIDENCEEQYAYKS